MRVSGFFGYAAAACLSASFVSASRPKLLARDEEATVVPKIAGGEVVTDDSFRFATFIEATKEAGGTTCTGSLIAPNVVLTAGHCVFAGKDTLYDASVFHIGFNHTTPSTTTTFKGYSVSKVVVNSDFNQRSLQNDLALLFLEKDVPSDVAETVKIFTGNVSTETQLFAAGFGITDPSDETSVPSSLMQVELKAGNDSFCRENSATYNPKYLICTDGTAGKDTCSGDSGGPLATMVGDEMVLVGLTSYAPRTVSNPDGLCGQAGSTGYYVHIDAYLSWITAATGLKESDITVGDSQSDAESSSSSSQSDNASVTLSELGPETDDESDTNASDMSFVSESEVESDTSSSDAPTASESEVESVTSSSDSFNAFESEVESDTSSSNVSTTSESEVESEISPSAESVITESGDVSVSNTDWVSISDSDDIAFNVSTLESFIDDSVSQTDLTDSGSGSESVSESSSSSEPELGELTDSNAIDESSASNESGESGESAESAESDSISDSFDSSSLSDGEDESFTSGGGLDSESTESSDDDIFTSFISVNNDDDNTDYSSPSSQLFSIDDAADLEHMSENNEAKGLLVSSKHNIIITLLSFAMAVFLF